MDDGLANQTAAGCVLALSASPSYTGVDYACARFIGTEHKNGVVLAAMPFVSTLPTNATFEENSAFQYRQNRVGSSPLFASIIGNKTTYAGYVNYEWVLKEQQSKNFHKPAT